MSSGSKTGSTVAFQKLSGFDGPMYSAPRQSLARRGPPDMDQGERAAWLQLAAALAGLSLATTRLHEASRGLAWAREDDMPDRRMSNVALGCVWLLFARQGIRPVEVSP